MTNDRRERIREMLKDPYVLASYPKLSNAAKELLQEVDLIQPKLKKASEASARGREEHGRLVHEARITWAAARPGIEVIMPPWDKLTDAERDRDRYIGEVLFELGYLAALEKTGA